MTPEQLELYNALTPLQRKVCTNVVSGMSQRQAYKAASTRNTNDAAADATVSKMLSMPKPAAFLAAMAAAAVSSAVMTKAEALEQLSRIARTPLSDLVEWARYPISSDMATGEVTAWQSGWRIKESAEQDPQKMSLIAELASGKDGIKIKTHSQTEAIKQLARMQGWDAPTKVAATNSAGQDVDLAAAGVAVLDALARKHGL